VGKIIGIVTTDKASVAGGAPIFHAVDRESLQKVANMLEKVLDCAAHEVHEDLFIIVDRN
jgi:hypothetical protein